MLTFRPGGYRWNLLREHILRVEKARIERQKKIEEEELIRRNTAILKIAFQSFRVDN